MFWCSQLFDTQQLMHSSRLIIIKLQFSTSEGMFTTHIFYLKNVFILKKITE